LNGVAVAFGVATPIVSGAEVTLAADGSFMYDPNELFEDLDVGDSVGDSFLYTIADIPVGATDTATVTITITGVNDAPVAMDDTDSTNEDTGTSTDVLFNDADVDGDDNPGNFTLDSIDSVVVSGLSIDPNLPAGSVTIVSNEVAFDPMTNFDELDVGDSATVTVGYTMSDDSGAPSSATLVITVSGLADPPVVTPSGPAANYVVSNPPVVVDGAILVTDADDTTLASATVTISNIQDVGFETLAATASGAIGSGDISYTAPTLTISPVGGAPVADFEAVLQSVTYVDTDNPVDETDRIVEFVVNDGALNSNTAQVIVELQNNTAPIITGGATATVNADENQTAVTDIESTDDSDSEFAGTLTYSFTTTIDGIDNGFFSIVPLTGVLTFATAPDYEAFADDNNDNDYEVEVTVTDSGALTDTQNITVTLDNVNDAPVVTGSGGTTAFTEDGGPVTVDGAITVTDQDGGNLASATVTITNVLDGANEVLACGACGGITPVFAAGTLTLTGPDTIANYQTALQSVTYDNANDDPDTTDRVIKFVANDGDLNSNDADKTVTIAPANDAPALTAPGPYDSLGNVGIDVPAAAGLLDAATIVDPDFAGPFTIGGTVPTSTANSGTVSINTTTGAFTYDPAADFSGPTDTFDYQVCDNGTPLPSQCSTPQTVTINIAGMIWFIDNDAVSGGAGTLNSPFDALADLGAFDGVGDCIFVADGTASYGAITLLNQQTLVGDGSTSTLDDVCGVTLPAHSNSLPTFTSTDPTLANVTLANDNTVRGLDISASSGTALAGSDVDGLSVSEVDTVANTGGAAVDINGGVSLSVDIGAATSAGGTFGIDLTASTGTFTFGSVSITNSGGTGLSASGAGTVNISTGTIDSGSGRAVDIDNTALGVTLVSVDSVGGSVPGIDLDTTTGSFTVAGSGDGVVDCKNSAAACAGGAITGKTGNVDGILLNNVTNVSLSEMNISSNSRNGIFGTNVNGITIDDSRLIDNSDQDNPNENAINFDGLTGTALGGSNPTRFSDIRVEDSHEHNVEIRNSSGTLTELLVEDSIFSNDGGSAAAGTNFNFLSQGTASMTLNVQTSEFIGNRVSGATTASGVFADGQSSATLDVTVQGSFFEDNNNAINVSHGGSGTVTFDISNNGSAARPIVGNLTGAGIASSHAINVLMSESSTGNASGVINGNFIGKSGVTFSGSGAGSGIITDIEGTGSLTVEIDGNTIRETNSRGIRAWAQNPPGGLQGAGGTLNVKVTNNTLDQVDSFGIYIRIRDESSNMCAKVEGNNVTNTSSTHVRVREEAGTGSLEVGSANLADTPLVVLTTNNPGASTWDGEAGLTVVSNGSCGF
jgi:VCBS repeat-containing protein